MTKQPQEQFYKMTLPTAIALFENGLITATALVYFYIHVKLKPGWKLTLHQRAICAELNIGKTAFYKAISHLKEQKLIEWEAPNGIVVSIPSSLEGKSESVCESPVRDRGNEFAIANSSPQIAETSPQIAETSPQIAETSPQIAETSPQIAENKTSNLASSNDFGDSPDLYQIFNRSLTDLSQIERDEFLKFCFEKAAQLPTPPALPEKWIEKNHISLFDSWHKTRFQVPQRGWDDLSRAEKEEAMAKSQAEKEAREAEENRLTEEERAKFEERIRKDAEARQALIDELGEQEVIRRENYQKYGHVDYWDYLHEDVKTGQRAVRPNDLMAAVNARRAANAS